MEMYTPVVPENGNGIYQDTEQRIKEELKNALPEDVYEKWVKYFVVEKIDKKNVTIGYYGTGVIKEFKKDYEEMALIHISSVLGYVPKLKIEKRSDKSLYQLKDDDEKAEKDSTKRAKINSKALKLYAWGAVFAAIMLALTYIVSSYIGNRHFKETFYSVGCLKTDSKIRVLQISDLHDASYGQDNSEIIERTTKLKPDLIIFTGDCLDFGSTSTDGIVNLCSSLTEVAPVYYIYGNNEVQSFYENDLSLEKLDEQFGFNDDNRNPEKLINLSDDLEKALEKKDVKVLKNETDTIKIGDKDVDIYGVLTSNPSSFWQYAGDSFGKFLYDNPNHIKIMAIHEPVLFKIYTSDSWGDLVVCGHTHGGTARIPGFGAVYTHEGGLLPDKKGDLVYGKYDVSSTPVVVSSGLINSNIFRLNNEPELVIIDMNRF